MNKKTSSPAKVKKAVLKGKAGSARAKRQTTSGKVNAKAKRAASYTNDDALSVVEEPDAMLSYPVQQFSGLLTASAHTGISGRNAAPRSISQMTAMEKAGMIKLGVSKKELEHLKDTASLDYDQLARALAVTRATLINKKGREKFSFSLSEKIISLADIYSYGYEVFDEPDAFNAWIFRPNKAIGGELPFNLLNNQYGREEIKNLIGRIEYGVYS